VPANPDGRSGASAWLTMSALQSWSTKLVEGTQIVRPDRVVELRNHSLVALNPNTSHVAARLSDCVSPLSLSPSDGRHDKQDRPVITVLSYPCLVNGRREPLLLTSRKRPQRYPPSAQSGEAQ
jgi:hypothetical protein